VGQPTVSAGRVILAQNVAYTGTAANSSAFGSQTRLIRLCASSACYIKIGEAGVTAVDKTDVLLPASWVDYFVVTPQQQVSVVRAGTDGLLTATSGSLSVIEMSP